jgi:SagB-type dehydrogenase family enzyme
LRKGRVETMNEGRRRWTVEEARAFLRATSWEDTSDLVSDQSKGIPHPPQQKPFPENAELIRLPSLEDAKVSPSTDLAGLIEGRRSRRRFLDSPMELDELSFLLWSTQGLKEVIRDGVASLRTVPSAGARHPFETYLHVRNVKGLEQGIYRFLPFQNAIYLLRGGDFSDEVAEGCLGQTFAGMCSVCFIWAVVPYRTEWRYSVLSPKIIAIDAGHVCQNLYLAAESIGLGTCAIAAYHQSRMDTIVGLDGVDEFVVYVAPVGRPAD